MGVFGYSLTDISHRFTRRDAPRRPLHDSNGMNRIAASLSLLAMTAKGSSATRHNEKSWLHGHDLVSRGKAA